MGWQTKSVVEQKLRFIQLWLTNEYTVKCLCESFGISRWTGYNQINNYYELGDVFIIFRLRFMSADKKIRPTQLLMWLKRSLLSGKPASIYAGRWSEWEIISLTAFHCVRHLWR